MAPFSMKKSDSDAPREGLSIDGLKTMIQRGRITNEWIDELLINEFRMHEIKNKQRTHEAYCMYIIRAPFT